jgi:hypothetical protein
VALLFEEFERSHDPRNTTPDDNDITLILSALQRDIPAKYTFNEQIFPHAVL